MSRRVRWTLPLLCLALCGVNLHAQARFAVYGTGGGEKSGLPNDDWHAAGTFGFYYGLYHFTPIDLSVDARGDLSSNIKSGFLGPRVAVMIPIIPIKPYGEFIFGVSTYSTPAGLKIPNDFAYRYVVGLEGSLAKTNLNGGTPCGPLLSGQPGTQGSAMFEMTCNAWANWIAEATARIGFTWDRALFYVKGGGAWTTERFSATCNLGPLQGTLAMGENCVNPARNPSNGLTASIGRAGAVIGWGTEFALTRNWSAKAETEYLSFADKNVIASDGSPLNLGMHIWETKIGVNYRFDGGPVVARY